MAIENPRMKQLQVLRHLVDGYAGRRVEGAEDSVERMGAAIFAISEAGRVIDPASDLIHWADKPQYNSKDIASAINLYDNLGVSDETRYDPLRGFLFDQMDALRSHEMRMSVVNRLRQARESVDDLRTRASKITLDDMIDGKFGVRQITHASVILLIPTGAVLGVGSAFGDKATIDALEVGSTAMAGAMVTSLFAACSLDIIRKLHRKSSQTQPAFHT